MPLSGRSNTGKHSQSWSGLSSQLSSFSGGKKWKPGRRTALNPILSRAAMLSAVRLQLANLRLGLTSPCIPIFLQVD
ncbi:hypothetical protein AZE42_13787 [Rhizopogon vesiculosus]|uniref:Uncharacterized protein n=1 Tax=Rhizopogon vesiculosus TaxID=180088 RepID=A0A1J8QAH8_9AGAM|nr:hypothetical protein AZE42_13787 [Rhizopogon vesiculosus]